MNKEHSELLDEMMNSDEIKDFFAVLKDVLTRAEAHRQSMISDDKMDQDLDQND
jgi:hypothetical protein